MSILPAGTLNPALANNPMVKNMAQQTDKAMVNYQGPNTLKDAPAAAARGRQPLGSSGGSTILTGTGGLGAPPVQQTNLMR